MIAHPTAAFGSFVTLTLGLFLLQIPDAKSDYWIGEVHGVSMAPTLREARISFDCRQCGKHLDVDCQTGETISVLRCKYCNTWQVVPETVNRIPADRVLLSSRLLGRELAPGVIIAFEHPTFGLVAKRIASETPEGYYVIGDNQWESLDSRNPRFGLVRRNQIRGIVVKILPAIPASSTKAK